MLCSCIFMISNLHLDRRNVQWVRWRCSYQSRCFQQWPTSFLGGWLGRSFWRWAHLLERDRRSPHCGARCDPWLPVSALSSINNRVDAGIVISRSFERSCRLLPPFLWQSNRRSELIGPVHCIQLVYSRKLTDRISTTRLCREMNHQDWETIWSSKKPELDILLFSWTQNSHAVWKATINAHLRSSDDHCKNRSQLEREDQVQEEESKAGVDNSIRAARSETLGETSSGAQLHRTLESSGISLDEFRPAHKRIYCPHLSYCLH